MKINIYDGKKRVSVEVVELGFWGRFSGLMFKCKDEKNLLFNFSKEGRIAIHSLFVFFPFLAVWLDDKNRVLEKKIVEPWKFSICPEKNFKKLVEIPLNKKNKKIINFFVGKKGLNR